MLMRETTLLAIVGAIAGIAMSFGTRWLMRVFVPTCRSRLCRHGGLEPRRSRWSQR